MLEIGTVVFRSSFSILGETNAFGSTWVKPNSLALATNPAMWLNLPLAHMVERETSGNLLPQLVASLKSTLGSRLTLFEAGVYVPKQTYPLTLTECSSGKEMGPSCSCPAINVSVLIRASSSEY